MLGKLIKHEFVATWKYFLLIDAITLIVGLVAGFITFGISGNFDNLPETLIIMLILCLTAYVFALVSVTVLTTAYNVVHYYKSLYTSQGYLTFTLPATTAEVLSAKMIVAFIWQIICALCVAISVVFLFGGFFFWSVFQGDVSILETITEIFNEFMETFGLSGVFALVRYIFAVIVQIIMNLMIFFMAISIGQLWQKHKILSSVLFYFVIRFVLGIATFIINLLTGSLTMLLLESADPARYFSHTTMISLIISLVFSIGMYIACIMITDKNLNLD